MPWLRALACLGLVDKVAVISLIGLKGGVAISVLKGSLLYWQLIDYNVLRNTIDWQFIKFYLIFISGEI